MDQAIGLDCGRRSTKCLSDDLAAIQPTPWVLRANSDEGVGAVWLEIEQSAEIHRRERNYEDRDSENYDRRHGKTWAERADDRRAQEGPGNRPQRGHRGAQLPRGITQQQAQARQASYE